MPPGRPPSVRHLLFLSLLVAARLQSEPERDHHHHSALQDGYVAESVPAVDEQWRTAVGQQLNQDLRVKHKAQKNTNVEAEIVDNNENQNINRNTNNNKKARGSTQQSALATVSPAESNDAAVRAPPAQWSSAQSSAGLASRHPARSLQDWQVEDIRLLATVDGKLHARDRGTGAPRWELDTSDMVQVIRHPHNKTYTEDGQEVPEAHFVVEPIEDGAMYAITPDGGFIKLDHTVKELSEITPWEETGPLAVTYTAEKRTTLYHIDAKTGRIRKSFLPGGSYVNEDQCRLVSPLDDDNECKTHGTITLGRTEYTVGIHSTRTGEALETLKYSEWAPNNRDNDLRSSYKKTLDDKYVYSRWNGRITGFSEAHAKPDFTQVLSSPVVRVFDLVRPKDDLSQDPQLLALPQPIPPPRNSFAGLDDDEEFNPVYINRTESGSWYALSEKQYPSVTDGAPVLSSLDAGRWAKKDFAGVYNLPIQLVQDEGVPLIDAPPPLQSKSSVSGAMDTPLPMPKRNAFDLTFLTTFMLGVMCTVAMIGGGAMYKWPNARDIFFANNAGVQVPMAEVANVSTGEEQPVRRIDEPAEELIFPKPANDEQPPAPARVHFDVPVETDALQKEPGDEAKDEETKPKKKATRGRRGGRKQKEKEQWQADARAAKKNDSPLETESPGFPIVSTSTQLSSPTNKQLISVTQSESPDMSGPFTIHNLTIDPNKEIGRGSGGTIVFEGHFEGRKVAVKRMLVQYYDLAELEVSFLHKSDGHTNVVRYFCREKDENFLYIAVELCQSSLFDVWEADKAKTEEQRTIRSKLKLEIQKDMKRSLHQLAAGLAHLHKLRILHRDIKPQNILVAYPGPAQPPGTTRLVISDFGLGKNLPENMSTLIDPTGNVGTSGWKAPELITHPGEKTESNHSRGHSNDSSPSGTVPGVSKTKRAADIFSLGCLYFWVLTDGIHPYDDEQGWPALRERNIKHDKKNMEPLAEWGDTYEPLQLITSMLAVQPEDRPNAQQVSQHPYFWTPEQRLQFLCDCSDHFEREIRGTWEDNYRGDSIDLQRLEARSEEVIGPSRDFLSVLDGFFVQTLGKQRKYTGSRFLDLLRALRNKKNHYEDMPENVKKLVGPLDEGYLNYWCHKFPRLLMVCHEVIQEAGLKDSARFKKYFEEVY